MASSKSLLLLFCALLALVLLVSAGVSTSHDDKISEESRINAAVDQYGDAGFRPFPRPGGGRFPRPGGGRFPRPGGGRFPRPGGHRGPGGHGGGCDYGCCRGYRYGGRCHRCCSNANEAPDAEFEDDTRN